MTSSAKSMCLIQRPNTAILTKKKNLFSLNEKFQECFNYMISPQNKVPALTQHKVKKFKLFLM